MPDNDDIKLDKEMRTIFDRITSFREKRAAKKNVEDLKEPETAETYVGCDLGTEDMNFDVASMEKKKITTGMPSTISTNRNIDDLMAQMEETFSQRLLRLIDERNLKDSEVYTKANVDRRHFSKIRKDVNYTPNKKTVLAFTIALDYLWMKPKIYLHLQDMHCREAPKWTLLLHIFCKIKYMICLKLTMYYMLMDSQFLNELVGK